MIVLNFSHPLTAEHLAQVEALAGEKVEEARTIAAQFDVSQPFAGQIQTLVEAAKLSPVEWQTLALVIVPPSLNYAAVAMLAELHGRMGYFPTVLRLRPVAGATPPRFEVAELINLQEMRERARQARGDQAESEL